MDKTSTQTLLLFWEEQLQHLHVSIHKQFKMYISEELTKWMTNTYHEFTLKGALILPTITQVCQWEKTVVF